jgi:N-acetylglucosaminyldiphosphoundecaprenol N-acetyl-beta-D-mannosaminyltransferase
MKGVEKDVNNGFEIQAFAGSKNVSAETDLERKETLTRIENFKPALLLVGYGAPWQEVWIDANRDGLEEVGVRVAMVVGGAFDEWAGSVRTAPGWLDRMGLKWLWRLVNEPWRWRRQLRLVEFMWLVVLDLVGLSRARK